MFRDNCGCAEGKANTLAGIQPKCDNISGTLEIFKEFNEVYKERLRDTESAGDDALTLKLKTLEDWVTDLTEQNTVLVETVEALEKEALYRLGIGMNMEMPDKSDCKTCKARRPGSLGVGARGMVIHSSDELHSRPNDRDDQLQKVEDKLQQSEKEIDKLKLTLAENESKLDKINEDILASEKSAREMRAALTAEVAEKHDQVLSLRREVQHLEDKLRQADMQTHFKDDIIKELRKEIKIANNKCGSQLKDKAKLASLMEDAFKNCKLQSDKCNGCNALTKVVIPQISALSKKVDNAICTVRMKSTSNLPNTQFHCFVEEILSEVYDNLSVIVDCLRTQDRISQFSVSMKSAKTDCNNLSVSFSDDYSVRELFRGKPIESSTTSSSTKCNVNQLLLEIEEQEDLIRDLNFALAEAQKDIYILTNKHHSSVGGVSHVTEPARSNVSKCVDGYASSDDRRENRGRIVDNREQSEYDTLFTDNKQQCKSLKEPTNAKCNNKDRSDACDHYNSSRSETVERTSYEVACDKLLDELRYLREKSQEDQTAMNQLECEMKSLMSAVNSRQRIMIERDDFVQILKDHLKCLEEIFLLGFNNLVGSDGHRKCEKLSTWKKNLLDHFKKATDLLKDIEHKTMSQNKEKENLISNQEVYEKTIAKLQKQLCQSQKAKETILEKLRSIEESQIKERDNISRGRRTNDTDYCDNSCSRFTNTSNGRNTVDKLMNELKCISKILEKSENQFLLLENDLSSLLRVLNTAERELSCSMNKASGPLYFILNKLEKELSHSIGRSKEFALQSKENECIINEIKKKIAKLSPDLEFAINPAGAEQNRVRESESLDTEFSLLPQGEDQNLLPLDSTHLQMDSSSCSSLETNATFTLDGFTMNTRDLEMDEGSYDKLNAAIQRDRDESDESEIATLNNAREILACAKVKLKTVGDEMDAIACDKLTSNQRKVKFSFQYKNRILEINDLLSKVENCVHRHKCATPTDSLIEHNDIMAKLNHDFGELSTQLQSRDKLISTQQDTIGVLQNSVQLQQDEIQALQTSLNKAVVHNQDCVSLHQNVVKDFEHKVRSLEEKLQESQNAAVSNTSAQPAKVNVSSSKGWAPWSIKQTPTRRHIHDV